MTPTTTEIREQYSLGYVGMFGVGWRDHPHACIRFLCDEVERLEREVEKRRKMITAQRMAVQRLEETVFEQRSLLELMAEEWTKSLT